MAAKIGTDIGHGTDGPGEGFLPEGLPLFRKANERLEGRGNTFGGHSAGEDAPVAGKFPEGAVV